MTTDLIPNQTDKAPLSLEQAIGKAYNKAAGRLPIKAYCSPERPAGAIC